MSEMRDGPIENLHAALATKISSVNRREYFNEAAIGINEQPTYDTAEFGEVGCRTEQQVEIHIKIGARIIAIPRERLPQ